MKHSVELVDEENDVYECSQCKRRGDWLDFIGTSCDSDGDDEINLSNNRSYGIFGPGTSIGNSILGGFTIDPID